jgi:amidase
MAGIHDLTAVEQATAIKKGELSAPEVLEHYLDRIARLDGRVGAFVTLVPDRARAESKAPPPGDSPLRGVPIGIKDLSPTRGVRTAFGSAALSDSIPDADSHAVAAVKAAGMPIVGKTATSEFGAALYTETALGPPARNPWRLDLTPGGSSGGAAAAVAAGMLPVAHGSDGGGSVRIPAALCGLVGYKPSRGVVPMGPGTFGAFGLPVDGAIGRTVADVAALTVVLARPVGAQPYPSPLPDPSVLLDLDGPAVPAAGQGPLRIGRFTRPLIADSDVDPACVAAVDSLAATLADLGHEIVEVEPPFDPDVFDLFATVWSVLSGWPLAPEAEELLTPLVRWLRARARATSALDLTAALSGLQARVEIATARLAGVDLTLCPTLAGTRASIGAFTAAGGPADDFAAQARFSPFCAPFNLLGAPAIALPVGETPDGLPVGAMLAGTPGADRLLLSVAAAVERARPWSHRHPAIWDAG